MLFQPENLLLDSKGFVKLVRINTHMGNLVREYVLCTMYSRYSWKVHIFI